MSGGPGSRVWLARTLRASVLCAAGLALLVPGGCSDPEPAAPALGPSVAAAGPADQLITVSGTDFRVGGQPYRFVGANLWYGMNLASLGPGGDRERLDRELSLLAEMGVTNLRVMAGSEGPDGEPWRVAPALQTAPGVYDPELLDGLDYLIEAAAGQRMRLVLCLTNFWPWTGGMAQYVSWESGEPIPYPAGPEADWDAYQAFASRFYESEGARDAYWRHVTTIVNRVNGRTGTAYRDDPVIMAWELANEPRGMGRAEAFNAWIDETAALIKSLDPNHLVTTGCEGNTPLPGLNGLDFIANHDGPHIDYATVHIWPQNWGWYDPADAESTFPDAGFEARAYLGHHEQLADQLNKPLVLEEFGLARDGGAFEPEASAARRDEFFAAMFEAVEESVAAGGPLAGSNFWAWAGEGKPARPGGFWETGDPWTGDPPHERQGWYGVYASDRVTLTLVRFTATALTAPAPGNPTTDH